MMKNKVDLIIQNARIYSVDSIFSMAEEMAIDKGKIIALGNKGQLSKAYYSDHILDMENAYIYPGFYDSHCHFYGYGLSLQQVDLVGTMSFDEVIERLSSKGLEQGKWLLGRGWDQNDWKNQDFPNKTILDSLFPNNPVFLKRIDGHAALVNQKALDIAGITNQTNVDGGAILIKNGEITGVLLDNAIELVSQFIPSSSVEDQITALKDAERACLSVGLTTIDDAGLDKEIITLIDSLQYNQELKIKVYAMLNPTPENFRDFEKSGIIEGERLSVRSFKIFADGALGSRGAALLAPYADDPHNKGLLLTDTSYIKSCAKRIYEMGFQMNTHCIGDAANRMVLNIYAEILKGHNNKRWRIEHAQVVDRADFSLFGLYNIIPSVQTTHATSDMYWARERLGGQRVANAYAYKQLMDENSLIVNGSDFPVESINPLYGFYAAVARKDLDGFPENGFQIENALSRKDALKAMTIWGAYGNFEEDDRGSLEKGKDADFVILDADIMEIPLSQIPQVKVLRTYINGELVYSR